MLYEKLSEKDLTRIHDYIVTFAQSAESDILSYDCADLSHILSYWDREKSKFLSNLFGGKLILEKKISMEQPEFELMQAFGAAKREPEMQPFIDAVMEKVAQRCGKWTDAWYTVQAMFECSTLLSNKIDFLSDEHMPYLLDLIDATIKIVPGSKLMKTLHKIAVVLGLETEFETFRLKHSMVLNCKKFEGTLCLSIHPLDYLTMSDNANGWSSCMSWNHDGDYRCGTIEMMNSPCTIVVYLRSNDRELIWNNQKWNSKQWRSLFVVDSEMCISIKGYPYQNEELVRVALEWIRELAEQNLQLQYGPTQPLRVDATFDYEKRPQHIELNAGRMYNDCGTVPHYGFLAPSAPESITKCYSGPLSCIWCGYVYDPYEENHVVCEGCCDYNGDYAFCDECGERYRNDDVYWVEDVPMCWQCFERLAITDDIWDDYIFRDSAIKIVLASENDNPSIANDDPYIWTHENRVTRSSAYERTSSYITRYALHPPHKLDTTTYYWNYSDLTDYGLRHLYGVA